MKNRDNHLRVFINRSEYYAQNELKETYFEGAISDKTKKRTNMIKEKFKSGFLEEVILDLVRGKSVPDENKISNLTIENINILVESLTSEVGRALIGLTIMQLCVKSISPEQNIRLHKGSINSNSFSWVEGISMRTLDKNFVTPMLRKYDLIRLNADGFMMTRSLAENYPYTPLYKANLRGARKNWLTIVEELEDNDTTPLESLKFLISKLLNKAKEFEEKAEELHFLVTKHLRKNTLKEMIALMQKHADNSTYAARLLEVSMHSLMNTSLYFQDYEEFLLKPLSQMRSANKKHGNIGDIELLENEQIIETWDAKYGKTYLREEIEEVIEKIQNHDFVKIVGFVTNQQVDKRPEIINRLSELEDLYGIRIELLSFSEWVLFIFDRTVKKVMIEESEFVDMWFKMYINYLTQKSRGIAPIDEPCSEWVNSLIEMLS